MTPSKKQRAAGAKPKGRLPQAEPSRRGRGGRRGAEPQPATRSKAAAAVDEAEREGAKAADGSGAADGGKRGRSSDAASAKVKPPFSGGSLVLVFLGAQLAAMLAYALIIPRTSYSPTAVAGVGGAAGQAASQVATGHAIAISVPVPIWLSTLLQIPLWVGLGLVPLWLAVKKGRGVVAELGLRMKPIDVPIGLAIGIATQLLLVPALYWLLFRAIGTRDVSAVARQLTDRATNPLAVVLVYVIVGVGAPIAEEIYFRGMALRVFGRRIRPQWAVLASAAFFAASHFQPLQFPALLVFGVVLGWLVQRFERLGPSIWAHLGFNVTAATVLLYGIGW